MIVEMIGATMTETMAGGATIGGEMILTPIMAGAGLALEEEDIKIKTKIAQTDVAAMGARFADSIKLGDARMAISANFSMSSDHRVLTESGPIKHRVLLAAVYTREAMWCVCKVRKVVIGNRGRCGGRNGGCVLSYSVEHAARVTRW